MHLHKGMSATIGILVIIIAIIAVGVAIYFVYQGTTNSLPLAITMDDRSAVEVGATKDMAGIVTASDTSIKISLGVTSPDDVSASIDPATVNPGDNFTLHLSGKSVNNNAEITVTATQGSSTVTHTVSVNVFGTDNTNTSTNTSTNSSSNTNQPTNTNSSTNTNQPTNANTNSSTNTGRFVSGDLNIAFNYPDTWGEAVTPELHNLLGTTGSMTLTEFQNINRFDIPGYAFVTGATANYLPRQWDGTPLWFSGTVDPTASVETITSQIKAVGFQPYEVSVVTIDGKKAVKMFYFRGLYSYYLDVAYLIPSQQLTNYATVMIGRSIEKIDQNDTAEETAIKDGNDLLGKLKNGTLSDRALRRYDEIESLIQSLTFIN